MAKRQARQRVKDLAHAKEIDQPTDVCSFKKKKVITLSKTTEGLTVLAPRYSVQNSLQGDRTKSLIKAEFRYILRLSAKGQR